MANYIVSDTNLTAVANAIRQKGGTSASLEFPDDFVEAIGDIQTGGGSSVTVEALNVTENGTYTAPTGTAYSPVTVNVAGSGSDTLAALEANTLTTWTSTATTVKQNLFAGSTALTSVSYPNATSTGGYSFQNCTGLSSINFPVLTSISRYSFSGCTSLVSVEFPTATEANTNCFENCTNLTTAIFGNLAYLYASVFSKCSKLNVLVLKKTSVCSLSNINSFANTPFASGKSGGTLYVPNDLIASYQSASNWSTILGYANNQIKAIEGSIYE